MDTSFIQNRSIFFSVHTELNNQVEPCQRFYHLPKRRAQQRAYLHGGGEPRVGEVTCLGGGNPPVHLISHINLHEHVNMIGGVTI